MSKPAQSLNNERGEISQALLQAPELVGRRVKMEKWRRSCLHFVQEAVRIEDRDLVDAGGAEDDIVIPFTLWDEQANLLNRLVKDRLTIILKARQLGITWLALSYAVWRMVHRAGYSVVGISRTEDEAMELARRLQFILRHLPKWLIQEKNEAKASGWAGITWSGTTLKVTVHHLGREDSTFKGVTSNPNAGRSFTSNLVILDEWAFQQYAADIWGAAYPTINRPTGGQVIGLSSNQRGSLFEQIYKDAVKGLNSFKAIFLDVWTDPRRTKEWYEQSKRDIPDKWRQEYPETPEQAMSAGEGTAFPEYSRDIHVCPTFTPPHWWTRWRGNDPGVSDPFAWYWLCVSESGTIYVYREYTRSKNDKKLTYSEQAAEVARVSKYRDPETADDAPEDIAFTVTGHDAFNAHPETGKAPVDYYHEGGGFGCIGPPKDKLSARKLRKVALHEYLKPYFDKDLGRTTAKLQIMDCCEVLIEVLPQLILDPNDSTKVKEGALDHWYDALGYALTAWHSQVSKSEEPAKGLIRQHKDKMAMNYNKRRL